ncbi:hypothetical protein FRC17_000874 [Serendipita sp. 399]|nr:hypothetical protein FRC17_000874 [Serendipita sp. 399]
MASSDLILHCSNTAGYGPLPSKWACAIVGGALFAGPTALSIFYSCCIAFNSQLAFLFHRRPSVKALRYYVLIPLIVCLIIYGTTLGTNSFGYDKTWGYCWYATEGVPPRLVLLRIVFTYCLPTLLCMLYLIIATITISYAVFWKQPSVLGLPVTNLVSLSNSSRSPNSPRESDYVAGGGITSPTQAPLSSSSSHSNGKRRQISPRRSGMNSLESSSGVHAPSSAELPPPPLVVLPQGSMSTERKIWGTVERQRKDEAITKGENYPPPSAAGPLKAERRKLSKRTLALRQLTIRLIGYIVTPILCLLPGIILDLVSKVFPDMRVPSWLNGLFDGLNGLVGLFNSILMLSDPSLLAVWDDISCTLRKTKSRGANRPTTESESPHRFISFRRREGGEDKEGKQNERDGDVSPRTRAMEESMMMSGFARTRMDDSEADEMDDELYVDEGQPTTQTPGNERGRQEDPRSTRADGDSGRVERPLEVRVTVNVTQTTRRRRLSKVELMENWLSGL